ncbi:MAG: hypothetical protein LBR64_06520 [Dysgonamonadaceae bacterium]|jgi:hypothetical protein|nr:hypothetical protein [Dysgonamonadaceae bacterium]
MEENYLNEKPLEDSVYSEPQRQTAVPNAVLVLILGILSIPTCCCYGAGLIFAIIALVLASSGLKAYRAAPEKYTPGSYSNLSAGKICAWIGIVLSVVYIGYIVWLGFYIGWENFGNPEVILDRLGVDPSKYGY